MHYQENAQGDWGRAQAVEGVITATEELKLADGCSLFMRSWKTAGPSVLVLLHGLGGHSGWYVDMGNELAARGITVYIVDHRGFGRSGGHPGHIESFATYLHDIDAVIMEIRKRHPEASLYLLGHSMGGIFTAHFAATYGKSLAGILFLNPWVADNSRIPLGSTLSILMGGLFKSRRVWQVAGGHEGMTTNPEAIRMLQADPYWRRQQTASFLLQILRMRVAIMAQAKHITVPALFLQAEEDKSILPAASRKLYEALASSDKTWKSYPGYAHDSQFEVDRSQMDSDIAAWIHEHSALSVTNNP